MSLFFKSACVLCGDSVSGNISLCKACKNDLPILEGACKQCGLPFNDAEQWDSVCGQCIKSPPAVDYTLSLYHYETPIDFLITGLKYDQQLSHAAILGELLLEKLQKHTTENSLPDCILPVPLHKSRLTKRGFNQSLEIARDVAKIFNIPISLDSVKRKRGTRTQTDLTAVERKKNMRGCFEVMNSHKFSSYKHIVILDDVVTTGSTVNELAKLLKKSGVEKVGVWSIARAILIN